jgi:hypothetical protein
MGRKAEPASVGIEDNQKGLDGQNRRYAKPTHVIVKHSKYYPTLSANVQSLRVLGCISGRSDFTCSILPYRPAA